MFALFLAAALQAPPPPVVGVAPPPAPPSPSLKIVKQPDPRRFYPARERKAGREGTSEVGLILRNDGRVAGCQVIVASGSAPLDSAACRLGRSLRFEPSAFAGRKPSDKYGCCMRVEVRWAGGTATVRRLMPPRAATLRNAREIVTRADYPAAALRAEAQGTVAVDLAVAADGTITGCTVTQSSGSAILDSATCSLAATRGQAEAARDRYGEPAPGTARFRIAWRLEG
jgi:TonB family protein